MKSAARKGARNEWRTIRWLESQGYRCVRSAGSHGVWDVIALGADGVLLVQVKSNRWPSAKELALLHEFPVPTWWPEGVSIRKVVHRWRDRQRVPDVREVA